MSNRTQNPSTNLPAVLCFEGAELKIIDRDGLPWITSGDLGRALGYKRCGNQVASIYRQHAHEFCGAMTTTIALRDFGVDTALKGVGVDFNADSAQRGNPNVPVRIFSPRGAHLIAMFARTAKATAFRRWVLDVLEGYDAPAAAPAPADPASLLRAMLAGNRFLCHLDDMGRVSLREIPDSHLIINPERLPSYLADPYGPKPQWLPGIAEVAVRRLGETGGHHAVQQALHAVNPDYLLVLQSELYSALYRATPEITTMKEVARGR